ncbi:MAG: cytochrome c oxidase assembly protein, partial [Acidimicrobiales bacterium]
MRQEAGHHGRRAISARRLWWVAAAAVAVLVLAPPMDGLSETYVWAETLQAAVVGFVVPAVWVFGLGSGEADEPLVAPAGRTAGGGPPANAGGWLRALW